MPKEKPGVLILIQNSFMDVLVPSCLSCQESWSCFNTFWKWLHPWDPGELEGFLFLRGRSTRISLVDQTFLFASLFHVFFVNHILLSEIQTLYKLSAVSKSDKDLISNFWIFDNSTSDIVQQVLFYSDLRCQNLNFLVKIWASQNPFQEDGFNPLLEQDSLRSEKYLWKLLNLFLVFLPK